MTIKTDDTASRAVQAGTCPAPPLTIGHYRFVFRGLDPLKLPAYAGSAWRGLFGHALKKAVCVTHEPVCANCLLYRNCAYPYIFETPLPPDTDRMKLYTVAPHPFVIFPVPVGNRSMPVGGELSIELNVFGRANAHLPYMVYAFQIAGKRGIGKSEGKFELLRIEQNTSGDGGWQLIWSEDSTLTQKPAFMPELPECPDDLLIEFQSPLRLKRDEHLVGAKEFGFSDLFRNLLRRIAMLVYFHEQTSFEPDFAGLAEASRRVEIIQKDLRWQDWTRYSSRQKETMQMGGLVGTIELKREGLQPFWPLLWLGQWTHAGKGASMGLGRYRIYDAASLPDRTNVKFRLK